MIFCFFIVKYSTIIDFTTNIQTKKFQIKKLTIILYYIIIIIKFNIEKIYIFSIIMLYLFKK